MCAALTHKFCIGQTCMWVEQCFSSTAFSPCGEAPHAHASPSHCLCTFFGWGSPVCGYHSVLLILHSLQAGEYDVHTNPSGFTQQHHAIPTESISGYRCPLYVHYGIHLFLLNLTPGGVTGDGLQWTWIELPSAIQVQETHKQWCLPVPLILVILSSPGELSWFSNLFYEV